MKVKWVQSRLTGCCGSDLTEKPAYVALKTLSLMTFDPGPGFTPQKLVYKIQGGTKDTFHTLLQKRDGTFLLILWQEVSSWDPKTMTPKRVAPNSDQSDISWITSVCESFDIRFYWTGDSQDCERKCSD